METSIEKVTPDFGNPMSYGNAGIRTDTGKHHALNATSGLDIFTLVKKHEELLVEFLIRIEGDIQKILFENSLSKMEPPRELEILFRHLYDLFQRNPHYLTLIFDKDLRRRFSGSEKMIARIRESASDYLKGVINRGKDEGFFTNRISTESLVVDILGSFRGLMNDIRVVDKMIADLKKLQTEND